MESNYYFDRNISSVFYNELISKIIYKYKYNYHTYISTYISDIIISTLELNKIYFDYILYVPLSKQRYKKRGFNQSEIIAKNIGKFYKKEVLDILIRVKNTRYLSNLKKEERKRELKDAFLVKKEYRNILSNKTIIIVDDIFTSGSTLNEISRVLKESFDLKFILCVTFATGKNM
ncbi:MAG: phosphoribosyltransferase family protein [Peptostreptococcaceae bacterium]|jgi:competence protein ComFC|nr:phosphoribosyltransferase family protein [Peptostreptococcaceae bacterium]